MDDDVIEIYDEIDEEPEQFTAQNYEYMLAQALLTKEAIQEKLADPSENANFQFVGSASHNNSVWNNFLAVTYGGVEQNFFKCRDCNEIFDKDPQKSLEQLRNHNCKNTIELKDEDEEIDILRSRRSKSKPIKKGEKPRILTREQLNAFFCDPKERKFIVTKEKSNFKCFAWQFLDVVFYKGQKQPFARCRYCEMLITYTNKNGTTSIRKHASRCPHIVQAKCDPKKRKTSSFNSEKSLYESNESNKWNMTLEESNELESSLIPEIEIYSDNDEDNYNDIKMKKQSNGILSRAKLEEIYINHKNSKNFVFKKPKSRESKHNFRNCLETVFYKDMKQDCYRCNINDIFISSVDENELTTHLSSHNTKHQNEKKISPNKKEKYSEMLTDTPKNLYLKKHSNTSMKLEVFDVNAADVSSETIAEAGNTVTNNLIDFVVATAGQSLNFIEDPSFRTLAQSLIHFGAKYGERNATAFLPSSETILKQTIPSRVRTLKSEIIALLTNEPNLNLSVDLITESSVHSNSISFLTVKAHIVTNNFESRVFVLGTNEFRNISHEAIHETFLSIIKEYIETETGDTKFNIVLNESNEILVKAFKNYTRLPSVTHNLEAIVNKVLQIEDAELNISDTVVKIQELFEHITTEHNYSISKGECLLDLLEEFYEMNKPIEKLLKHTRPCHKDHTVLFDISKHTVKTVLNVFQVIKLCVDTIRQNQISISGILLWKKKLVEQYAPVLYEHRLNARLKFHTLELIEKCFVVDHPIYKIALFLNPNFKSLKFLSENERQEVFKSIKEIFLTRLLNVTNEFCDGETDAIDKEINKYYITKSFDFSNEDLLEFWKKITLFPNLRALARYILSIPGTSDGVNEDVFQRANRSLASGVGTTLDLRNIVFLNSNSTEM